MSRAFAAEWFARPGADSPVDRGLRLDAEVMLVDDPVKRVDNMTMAHGLEARRHGRRPVPHVPRAPASSADHAR